MDVLTTVQRDSFASQAASAVVHSDSSVSLQWALLGDCQRAVFNGRGDFEGAVARRVRRMRPAPDYLL